MSIFDSAQNQCSGIEYDLFNLVQPYDRDIHNSAKWDWLRENGIKKDITF